jgi:hypothetical protein
MPLLVKIISSVISILILVTLIGLIIAQVRSWSSTEKFNQDGIEVTGYGKIKYDLRGEEIKGRNISL